MPAGLGGGGWLAIALEATMGTYIPPTDPDTVWVPILNESLKYTEDKYYSEQIRQQTIDSDVSQSYYHVEGDVAMEVDVNYLPYFLHSSRHSISKTGAAAPFEYAYTPSQAGSASTAASGNVARTASITVVRNGIGFGYAGCVMNTIEFTIENGVLRATFGVLGLSEEEPAGLGTPTWLDPELFGADTHSIYVAASGVTPTFGSNDTNFNGFTANINYNGAAQNRIVPDRAATYISFGKTEMTYNTELDFTSRAEYDNFVASTQRAIRLESIRGTDPYATANEAFRLDVNRSAYDTYDIGLAGIGDLIMAGVTARALGIAGGVPYRISVKTPVAIA